MPISRRDVSVGLFPQGKLVTPQGQSASGNISDPGLLVTTGVSGLDSTSFLGPVTVNTSGGVFDPPDIATFDFASGVPAGVTCGQPPSAWDSASCALGQNGVHQWNSSEGAMEAQWNTSSFPNFSPIVMSLGGGYTDVYTAVRFKQTAIIGNYNSNMKWLRQKGPNAAGNHGLFAHSSGDQLGYYFDDNVASGSLSISTGMGDGGKPGNWPSSYDAAGAGGLWGSSFLNTVHEIEWHWWQDVGVGQKFELWINGNPFTPPDSSTTQDSGEDAAWAHDNYWGRNGNTPGAHALWSRAGLSASDPSILYNSNGNTNKTYNFLAFAETWSGQQSGGYSTSGSLFLYKAAMSTKRIGTNF